MVTMVTPIVAPVKGVSDDKPPTVQLPIAHAHCDSQGVWAEPHLLEDHLLHTAELAGALAKPLGANWAVLAGRWHDLGKYRQRFQDYIRLQSGFEAENAHIENGKRAPHSTAGAVHAIQQLGPGIGHILAYIIAGHHAGLPDFYGGRGSLNHRLIHGREEYAEALAKNIPEHILAGECELPPDTARRPECIALWMRLVFSCLVDADFLDTERYMQPRKFAQRQSGVPLSALFQRFQQAMAALRESSLVSPLNTLRQEIYQQCLAAAEKPGGVFSLTVPTGGGKTLSSLAFALSHAQKYGKQRIIYAIPFTSIIEQNAQVFRKFLGGDAVLEHHSSLDVDPTKENLRSRLSAENWQAPLIVTTNVQLFESLHAARTSRCRKLHNLINSVIILDEAQQLPRDFHAPITRSMQQLSDFYGVTWVLCTATQPELGSEKNTFGEQLLEGLDRVQEIIAEPAALAKQLKRVNIHLPRGDDSKLTWPQLAEKIQREPCALIIVNTRKHARLLCELLNVPGSGKPLHLSANMCAEHRSQVLAEIRQRLERRKQADPASVCSEAHLWVVSTQLIEAGVDVDFPVVYRAMAGLDAIAQAAGRCNREGRLPGMGRVEVFTPEDPAPPGFIRQGADTTLELLAGGLLADPLAPASFKAYFKLLNSKGERDKHGINELLTAKSSADTPLAIQFREAAQKFRLIDDAGEAVVVPYVEPGIKHSPVEAWLNHLEQDPSQKWLYRKLQRYTITLREPQIKAYRQNGCIDLRAGLNYLLPSFYHAQWGADCPDLNLKPEECVF